MVSRFKSTIRTAHGSSTFDEDANDVRQIAANMPDGVSSYTVDGVKPRMGIAPIEARPATGR